MAKSPKDIDSARLDEAADILMSIMREEVPEKMHPDDAALLKSGLTKGKTEAAGKLVLLLERRAKMHGYDAAPKDDGGNPLSGSLAELEQKLALTARAGEKAS